MTRINTTKLAAVTPRLSEPSSRLSAQVRPLSQSAAQPVRSSLANTLGGVSSFQPALATPLPTGPVASQIRQRLNTVLGNIPRNLEAINRSFTGALTQAEQKMVASAPPEMRYALEQQFKQQHQQTLQELRSGAAAVGQPFSAGDTAAGAQRSIESLNRSLDREFQSLARHANALLPQDRARVLRALDDERHYVGQQLQGPINQMLRPGATVQDVTKARQQIDQILSRSMDNVRSRLGPMVPPENRSMLLAEIGMQHENQQAAVHSLFSHALQPKNPLDFSKVPGAPPMTGKLTNAQAQKTLAQLESGIQQQYQLRLQQANTLPPEQRMSAQFDAAAQRDRMLATAYRNVLGRLTTPTPVPVPTKPTPVLR